MGITLELAMLLALSNLGMLYFGAFEAETPRWRLLLKWTLVYALTLGAALAIGHWALLVPSTLGGAGLTFHLWWCRRHGIDPWSARPRERYYRLRGWSWPPA